MVRMNEALKNLLKLAGQNSMFLCQVSADVSALKEVIYALGPEAGKLLDQALALHRGKIQSQLDSQQALLQSLQASISKMPN